MKNKKSTALLLALLMMASVFLNATSVFAEGKQEAPRVNQSVEKVKEVKVEDKKDDAKEVKAAEDKLEISKKEAPDAVGEPAVEKTFTVTKRPVGSTGDGELVGEYDTLMGAIGACKQEDLLNEYIVTMNKDYTVPENEGVNDRSHVNILFKSAQGSTHTLKRLGTRLVFYVSRDCKMRIENVILDGNNDGELTSLSENGELTLGNGTVVQNFIDVPSADGPAIYLINRSTLNIEDGVIIQNNKGNSMGGIIGDNSSDTTININGGTFTGNSSKKWGGVIGSFGKVTINGGKFTDNQAGSQGGVIYSNGNLTINDGTFSGNSVTGNNGTGGVLATGTKAKLNVNGGTFKENSAKYGSVIYTSNTKNVAVKKATIESNVSGFGAVYFNGGSASVESAIFNNNLAINRGSAIYNRDADVTVNKSIFKDNGEMTDADGTYTCIHGGAIAVEKLNNDDTKLTVKGSTFEGNKAKKDGGAIHNQGANLDISGSTFKENEAGIDGGAIYTNPYKYEDPINDAEAYKKLKVDDKTLFKGNVANAGLFSPPKNYADFTDLKFDPKSDVDHGKLTRRSLLNNYDVNYKNPKKLIIFDANGGKFSDGTKIKSDTYPVDDVLKIMEAPTRKGYKFLYWKGSKYNPGDKYTVKDDHTFVAQWEAEPKKPDNPNKPDNPTPGGGFYFVPTDTPLLNRKDHAQYMIGYPDQNFKPDNHMSRQEVTVMFSRLLNERPQKGVIYRRDYKDIPDDLWSVTAISYMSKLGMVKGYPDGNFMPRADITRAEFAAMATRFADISSGSKTFTDVSQDHWAYDVIQKAAAAGWISGYPDGSFKPDQPITRAEVVAITNRMLNRFADEAFVDAHQDKILQFKDMNKGMWSYYPVVEATNGHGYERKTNGKDEAWFEVNGTSFVYDK